MPFERPSLAELITRAQADAEARLADGAPVLPVSNIAVLARVHAGGVHGLYGYLDWLARQLLPDTAGAEWLERHAAIWSIARLPATYAAGAVAVTGAAGAVVPEGTRLRRADGVEVITDALCTVPATVAVTAAVAGAGGNTAAGVALTVISAVAGVQSAAVVAAGGITGGAAAEDDDALRARLLSRLREPPQGGSQADYVAWALAAHPAVTRAWCYPLELGPGTVTVRVMTDDASADGLPSAGVIAAVQAALDVARPVTAAVTAVAPVAAPLAITLALTPDSAATRAAVSAALTDLIRREATPGGTLLLSHLREAISTAVGEIDHALSAPLADVGTAAGAIVTLGTITWE